jgi:DNA repair protein RecO (recombination protein O)
MKTFKTRGLVLREYEAGESDKRLLLLCKGVGRLFVYARGARKPKSKFIASAQLFTYSDLVITQGRGFHSLAQASVIENFYNLRTRYDALCCAHVMMEINEKTILEDENCDELLLLTLKALGYLNKTESPLPPLQVLAVFMLRFFLWYGVTPNLTLCCVCDGEIPPPDINGKHTETPYICAEGLLCNEHKGLKTGEYTPVSPPTLTALRYIAENDLSKAFLFTTGEHVIQEMQNAALLLWRHHFDCVLQSMGFLP